MLRLRHQVGSEKLGIATVGENNRLGGTCKHIDRAVESHHLLRRRHIAVARANNFGDSRHGICAIGKGSHRLRAANAIEALHAEHGGSRESLGRGARGRHLNAPGTRNLRGNHRHEHGRRQWIPPAGNVAANRCDRFHPLSHADARLHGPHPRPWHLPLRKLADVARGSLDGLRELRRDLAPGGFQFLTANQHGFLFAEAVQFPCIPSQGFVALRTNVTNDLRDRSFHLRLDRRAARDELFGHVAGGFAPVEHAH